MKINKINIAIDENNEDMINYLLKKFRKSKEKIEIDIKKINSFLIKNKKI